MGMKECSKCDQREGCTKKHEWTIPCPTFHRERSTSTRQSFTPGSLPLSSGYGKPDVDVGDFLPSMPKTRKGWRPGQEHILARIQHRYGEAQSIREAVEKKIEREKQKE